MSVETAIRYYDDLVKRVFSEPKPLGGDGKFSARKLEAAIKYFVKDITGDSESFLLEANETEICRT